MGGKRLQYKVPNADIALKDFFSDNNVYASVYNDSLFKEDVIRCFVLQFGARNLWWQGC